MRRAGVCATWLIILTALWCLADDATPRLETIRTLAGRTDSEAQALLRSLAENGTVEPRLRLEAIAGLARSAEGSGPTRKLLLGLATGSEASLQCEALRSLRGLATEPDVARVLHQLSQQVDPKENLELAEQIWLAAQPEPDKVLSKPFMDKARRIGIGSPDWQRDLELPQGDPRNGERVFFHLRGPQCSTCHRVNGRGGPAGPDLSHIASKLHACKLQDSIIDPSKEIAPEFTTWQIATRQGQVLTGIILTEDASGTLTLASAKGEVVQLRVQDIAERQAQKTSIMPDNLRDQMTWQELWDVIAFMGELK